MCGGIVFLIYVRVFKSDGEWEIIIGVLLKF